MAFRASTAGTWRVVLIASLVAACGRMQSPSAGPQEANRARATPAEPSGKAVPRAPAGARSPSTAPSGAIWPSLVRKEEWDAAWRALASLPEHERSLPEVRYVQARVALARSDPTSALRLLEGLDGALPLLEEDIARRRAQAMLEVGPYSEAGEWFAKRETAGEVLDAALAFEKAKDAPRARAAAARVLANDRRTRSQEAEARALRVRLADHPSASDRADARWLATQGADLPAASQALAQLARLDPSHPLTAEEFMIRARTLSAAGRLDDALRALDREAAAPDRDKVTRLDRMRARGMALFHARGHGEEAARVLGQCAAAGGPHAAEDAFHAARALSRADRDDEAVRGYAAVERRFPASPWAAEASFYGPYLRMLHAAWHECAAGFAAYVRAHSDGLQGRAARRDGALCRLLDGDAKGARSMFEQLAASERNPTLRARMADMAALAALREGDRDHAMAQWTDIARSRPLSWPALVARAHLAEAGVPMPVSFQASAPPSTPPPPLTVSIPEPVDMLHRLGLDADAELALYDREGAVASIAGTRAPEALCQAYGELDRARRRYEIARRLPLGIFSEAPDARARWAWDCAYPSPYPDEVHAAERSNHLPPGLLWAVMRQESGFDPDVVSKAHAVGLMQILPETARPVAEALGLSQDDARLTSPPYAIAVGARVLRQLLDEFGGSVPLALAAYNAGSDAVERWKSRASGMQVDTFVERIPYGETREYVGRVMSNVAHYAYLAGGDSAVPSLRLDLP